MTAEERFRESEARLKAALIGVGQKMVVPVLQDLESSQLGTIRDYLQRLREMVVAEQREPIEEALDALGIYWSRR